MKVKNVHRNNETNVGKKKTKKDFHVRGHVKDVLVVRLRQDQTSLVGRSVLSMSSGSYQSDGNVIHLTAEIYCSPRD